MDNFYTKVGNYQYQIRDSIAREKNIVLADMSKLLSRKAADYPSSQVITYPPACIKKNANKEK